MITILADDLSGALDTGVMFRPWIPTEVWPEIPRVLDQHAKAVVMNMNTRHATSSALTRQYLTGISKIPKIPSPVYYIKVDSTLRGPIAQTLKILLQALPQYHGILLCSAFPETGRTIIGGHLMVDGQFAETTSVAYDPHNPLTTGDIPTLVHDVDLPVTIWDLHRLRNRQLPDLSQRRIYVADAVSRDDLTYLSQLSVQYPGLLPVGSAGWAKSLAEKWCPESGIQGDVTSVTFDQIVAVVGSMHPRSSEQIDYVTQRPGWHVETLGSQSAQSIALPQSGHIIFRTPRKVTAHAAENINTTLTALHTLLASKRSTVLVSTGGDTSLILMQQLQIRKLEPLIELSPGVVMSRGDFHNRPLYYITKSGAFGPPSFFKDLERLLTVQN